MSQTSERNLQLVQSIYQAFGRGDVPTILAALAEDVVWDSRYPASVPFGGEHRGHAGVVAFLQGVQSAVAIDEFAPTEFVADDRTVVVLGHERARAASTGRAYANHWVHVFRIADGRVRSVTMHNDTKAAHDAFASV